MAVAAPLLVLLLAAVRPTGPGPVTSLVVTDPPIDDSADLLHIVKRSGRAVMGVDVPTGRLEVEYHRAGQKPVVHGIGYDVSAVQKTVGPIEFTVQAADGDYLPIISLPRAQSRVLLKLRLGRPDGPFAVGKDASSTHDLPKEVFDFGRVRASQAFGAAVGTATEVPLFWLGAGTANASYGASTPKQAIELNPTLQVAVAYLRFGPQK